MRNKTLICILLTVTLSLFFCQSAFCDNMTNTLKGIKAVRVKILLEGETSTISASQLQTDVELKLRLAGIKVDSNASETLIAAVNIIKIEPTETSPVRGLHGSVKITLSQEIRLERDPTLLSYGPTWTSNEIYFHGGTDHAIKLCRDAVRDLTDEFINAYLSVNQK
jgi:hypothetical protein